MPFLVLILFSYYEQFEVKINFKAFLCVMHTQPLATVMNPILLTVSLRVLCT